MKRIFAIIGMAGALAAPSLHASIVVLTELPGEANNGGPFHAVTTDNGAFNTFCISIATTFSPGTPYYYDVSSTITANGVPPAPDYIALGTAYIYNQYLQNNANYVNNASAVQSAIWYFQGLLTQNAGVNSGDPTDPENNVDLQSDISKIEGFMTAAGAGADISGANGKGAFGIEAMNLYTSANLTGDAQSQLIAVPEPTTLISGALLLLPFGASTLRILRKNRAA